MFSIKNKLRINESSLHLVLLFLCALLPFQFALNPLPGFDLAILRLLIPAIFLIWITKQTWADNKDLAKQKMTKLVLFFLLLSSISLFFTENFFWSLRKLLFLFSFAPIYFVSLSFFKKDRSYVRKIILALVSGATILSFVTLIQFFSQFIFGINNVYDFLAKNISPLFLGNSFSKTVLAYPSWLVNSNGTTYMRAIGIFPDPHMLSYYLELMIPWSIALAFSSKRKTAWRFLPSAMLIMADIATFTRGGYIALIASAIIIIPLVDRSAIKKILLSIAVIIIFFLNVPHNPVTSRLNSSFDMNEGSNHERLSNWQQAVLIIKNNPLGVGIGMYSLAVNPQADYRQPIYAHNLYLDIAAEMGIVTAILFVAILILAFSSFWIRAKKDPFWIAGVASITLFSVHSLVESPLYSVHVLPVFFIFLAMASISNNNEKNKL